MKLRIFIIVTILAAVLFLSSCVTSHDFNVDLSCDEFSQNSHRTGEFKMEVGDKLRVKLCSNPTTGFQWDYEVMITDGDEVLKEEDRDFEEPEDEGLVGAAGKDVWTFEAVEKGIAEVRMEYSRPWEGGEKAEWTYTVNVTVE